MSGCPVMAAQETAKGRTRYGSDAGRKRRLVFVLFGTGREKDEKRRCVLIADSCVIVGGRCLVVGMSGDTERGRICTPPCGCTCRFALVRFEATAAITVVKYGDCRWCGPLPCGKGSRVRSRSFRFGRSGYLFPLVPSCFRQDSVSLAVYSSRPVQASSSRSSTSSKPSLPS